MTTNNHKNQWKYDAVEALPRTRGRAAALRQLAKAQHPVAITGLPSEVVKAIPAFQLSIKRWHDKLHDIVRPDDTRPAHIRLEQARSNIDSITSDPPWGCPERHTYRQLMRRLRNVITWREPNKDEKKRIRHTAKLYEERTLWQPMAATAALDARAASIAGPLRRGIYHGMSGTTTTPGTAQRVHTPHVSRYNGGKWSTVNIAEAYYTYTASVRQLTPTSYEYRIFDDDPVTVTTPYPFTLTEQSDLLFELTIGGQPIEHHVHPLCNIDRKTLRRACIDKLRKRRQLAQHNAEAVGNVPMCTKITLEHSYRAGNCSAGTLSWLRDVGIDSRRPFVRLHELLAVGGDNVYFRRVLSVIAQDHKNDACPVVKRMLG